MLLIDSRRYSGINWGKQLCVLIFLSLSFPVYANHQNIKLLKLDWSSQQVMTHVLHLLFASQHVNSEIVVTPAKGQWFYLNSGRADIQVEVWEGTMSKNLNTLLTKGQWEIAATHEIMSREGWWYPTFAESLCPGLPSWEALARCKGVFTNEDGIDTYYSGPWEKPEHARIRALELPFKITQLADGYEINHELVKAMEEQRPVLIFNWYPNWVWEAYDGKFVEFPKYDTECEIDKKWGVNPKFPWDCDNPQQGWLKSVISSTVKANSPCGYAITKSFVMTADDLNYASYLVDVTKLSVEDAARVWVDKNHTRIEGWTGHSECKNTKKIKP